VLEGTLDLTTSPRVLEALTAFVRDQGPDVTVDAARLDFIDSMGVGTLVRAAKAARDAGGMLYLQNPAEPVRRILETCGLGRLFPSPTLRPVPKAAAPEGASLEPAAKPRSLRRAA